MDKKKKVLLYDVFDVNEGSWSDCVTLDEIEKELLSFSEFFDYYTAERDIARKLFKSMLKRSHNKISGKEIK